MASRATTEVGTVFRRVWKPSLVGLLLWVVFIVGLNLYMTQRDGDDPKCFEDTFSNDDVSTDPIALTAPSDELLSLRFEHARGKEQDEVIIAAAAKPPEHLEVAVSALSGERQTISSEDVRVKATSQRNTVFLDLCFDARDVGRIQNGTYKGLVTFTDERVSALAIPVEATFQSRYLWWLAPLVLLMPLVALYVTWGSLPSAERPTLSHGLVRTFVVSVAAAGVVFGAQGIANQGWGGVQAAFGLIGGMYAAAAGAAVTVGSATSRENQDPPPPNGPPPAGGPPPAQQ